MCSINNKGFICFCFLWQVAVILSLHTPLYDTFCTKLGYHLLFEEFSGNVITPQGYMSGLSGTPCVIDAMRINLKLIKCFAVFGTAEIS